MTDKVQEIRKEVERLRSLHQIKYQHLDTNDNMCLVECGMRNLCNDLLLFIDSLQEEPVSEDLEKEISDYLTSYHLHIEDGGRIVFDNNDSPNFMCDIRHIAKYFFDLGFKARGGK